MPLTVSAIMAAEPTVAPVDDDSPFKTSDHLGRIRFLYEHGWHDPIHVDVGCPELGWNGPDWPVIDGNHRLAAAILRGDQTIDVHPAGDLDHANGLLQPDRPW